MILNPPQNLRGWVTFCLPVPCSLGSNKMAQGCDKNSQRRASPPPADVFPPSAGVCSTKKHLPPCVTKILPISGACGATIIDGSKVVKLFFIFTIGKGKTTGTGLFCICNAAKNWAIIKAFTFFCPIFSFHKLILAISFPSALAQCPSAANLLPFQ